MEEYVGHVKGFPLIDRCFYITSSFALSAKLCRKQFGEIALALCHWSGRKILPLARNGVSPEALPMRFGRYVRLETSKGSF